MSNIAMLERILDSCDFSVGGGSAVALSGQHGRGSDRHGSCCQRAAISDSAPQLLRNRGKGGLLSKELMLGAESDAEAYDLLKAHTAFSEMGSRPKRSRRGDRAGRHRRGHRAARQRATMSGRGRTVLRARMARRTLARVSDLDVASALAEAAVPGCVRKHGSEHRP